MKAGTSAIAIGLALSLGLSACAGAKGTFFLGALGLGEPRILVASQNTGSYTVSSYDLDGNLMAVLWDSTWENDIPKGIALLDALNFAILLDGNDRIVRRSLIDNTTSSLVNNANLTGTLYQLAYDQAVGRIYAIEGNFIEAFSANGTRVGNPYIATTVGGCTLSTSRSLVATSDQRLIVTGTGNDLVLIYDVSGATPTCLTSNTSLNGLNPIGMILHSDGNIYVSTQQDDRVYSLAGDGSGGATIVWATNLGVISNPTELLELPDGSLLVASDGTNSIERIDTSGNQVGSTSFIRNGFTGLVTQMLLIGAP